MHHNRKLQTLFLFFVLSLAVSASLSQNVSAVTFFDGRVVLSWKADPALRTFLGQSIPNEHEQISVILVFSEVPSAEQLEALRSLGAIRTFTGHVATMNLPMDSLQRLAALNFVDRISKPKSMKSQLDVSVPEILADKVWKDLKDTAGNPVDGSGVIIGIIDSGIDYLHRDFYFKNGTSKILYIWDQTVRGRQPTDYGYGNECTPVDIQIKACSEVDRGSGELDTGHGTAVAAVAASTGQATTLLESCVRYDGTRWFDDTTECQNSVGTPFPLLAAAGDFRYFAHREEFNSLFFELAVAGDYGTLAWEYSKGSGSWATLKIDSDGTSGFGQNGAVVFTPPNDWARDAVNGVADKFWIRIKAVSMSRPASVYHVQENPPYAGVAPGASIIAVKLLDGYEDHVLDGTNYVIRKARELGRPVVIDHSLSDHLGSHDGTEPLELAFTDFAVNGTPVVVSAGNSRNIDLHVTGKLSPAQTVTVNWAVYENVSKGYVDFWYPVSDFFAMSLRTPSGQLVTGPTTASGVKTPDGNVIVLSDKRAIGKEWWINVTSLDGKNLRISPWSFTLTGITVADGKWDAWVEPGQFTTGPDSYAKRYTIDPQDTVDAPGTATGVITVGAYMTKYYWRSGCTVCIARSQAQGLHGIWWTTSSAPGVGEITYSSAMGPTRDGRTKPDIVAPGSNIAAARAYTKNQRDSDPDNYHQIWRGTSFAAPHVAGIIALMLQMNPYLSPNEIKSILTSDARQDNFSGVINTQVGSPLWGWGKVDALKSTQDAPKLYSVRLEIVPIGRALTVDVTLDGDKAFTVPLNKTRIIILEFRRDGSHSVEVTPTIPIGDGIRFAVSGSPWTFSSGGIRKFQYRLQYFLQVQSSYGLTAGTGWYDANSTATISVISTSVLGNRFLGWSGAVTSSSPVAQVKMDSAKQVVAQWTAEFGPFSAELSSLLVILIPAVAIIVVAFILVRRVVFRSGVSAHRAPESPSEA